MLKLVADENFNYQIVTGIRRRFPELDLVTIQEAGRKGALDPDVLEWAAHEARVIVTHDTRTMGRYAYDRVAAGKPMPGVLEIPDRVPVGQVIDELLLIVQLIEPAEIRDRVLRLPL